MIVNIFSQPIGQANSGSLGLSIDYRNRGISFSFTFLRGVAAVPLVEEVSVSRPEACLDIQ